MNKTVELRTGALENGESLETGADRQALVAAECGLGCSHVGAVAVEGVGVGGVVDGHACPAVRDDLDVRGMDVGVGGGEVGGQDGGEELGGRDWVLFGEHWEGVRRYYGAWGELRVR